MAGVEGLITFEIDGDPVSKGRPRFTRSGITFTPLETRNYEAWVKTCAVRAMAGGMPLQGPVELDVMFALVVPRSWPAWRREAALDGCVMPVGRPDCDNLLKAVMDSLNGIVWRDDSQIVVMRSAKRYADRSGATVIVRPLVAVASAKEWKARAA